MSLINQMLKDLETRSKSSGSADSALIGLQSAIAPSFDNDKKFYIVLGFLIIIAFFISLPMMRHAFVAKPKPVYHEQAKQLIEKNIIAIAPIPDSGTLTGITLQVQPNKTSLRFLLNQNPLYTVSSTADEQELTIVLENTRLIAALPHVDYAGSAIHHIETIPISNGNLKIVLLLNPGAEISQLNLNDNRSPELQLDLSYPTKSPDQDIHVINLKTPVQEKTDVDDQYQFALSLSSQGSNDKSIQLLKQLLLNNPNYTPARESLASMLLQQGNNMEAEKIIDIGLQQQPSLPSFVEIKARILVNQGKVEKALELLQLVPPAIRMNPDYYGFIAALYERQGEPALAAKLYEQLTAIQPANAKWWVGLGIALESQNNLNQALVAYAKAEKSGGLTPELKAFIESRLQDESATTG